jgi:hypothetical protein
LVDDAKHVPPTIAKGSQAGGSLIGGPTDEVLHGAFVAHHQRAYRGPAPSPRPWVVARAVRQRIDPKAAGLKLKNAA